MIRMTVLGWATMDRAMACMTSLEGVGEFKIGLIVMPESAHQGAFTATEVMKAN